MSKRKCAEPTEGEPDPKRGRAAAHASGAPPLRAHEVAAVLVLVPDVYGIIARALDPISQRAFCCASRDALELMGPHRRAFPLPMLQWVPSPEDVPEFWFSLCKHRRAVAKRRMLMGACYDHVEYLRFHMPFFDVVLRGVVDKPRKWLFLLMDYDARDCFSNILLPALPNAHMTEVGLSEAMRDRFLDGDLKPALTKIAMARKWITFKDVLEFDQEHHEARVLRTVLHSASPEQIHAASIDWSLQTNAAAAYAAAACRRMLGPAFRQFAGGNPAALNAIVDAMEADDYGK